VRPRRQGLALLCGPSTSPLDVVTDLTAEAGLAALIYAAFSSAPRPTPDVITPHRCEKCDDLASRLAPYEARQVPDSQMDVVGGDLPLLGPEAFRYYLPRFMEFSLLRRDSDAAAFIIYNLAPDPDLDIGPRNRFLHFTPEERESLRKYIEYRIGIEDPEIDKAIIEELEKALQPWRDDV
jgi:hypothetical protein